MPFDLKTGSLSKILLACFDLKKKNEKFVESNPYHFFFSKFISNLINGFIGYHGFILRNRFHGLLSSCLHNQKIIRWKIKNKKWGFSKVKNQKIVSNLEFWISRRRAPSDKSRTWGSWTSCQFHQNSINLLGFHFISSKINEKCHNNNNNNNNNSISEFQTWSSLMEDWSAKFLILVVAALIWSSEISNLWNWNNNSKKKNTLEKIRKQNLTQVVWPDLPWHSNQSN